jgi:hypothetical protein
LATIDQMINSVRGRLMQPRSQRPSDRDVYRSLLDHLKNLYNHLSNTGHTWEEYELTVTVSSGQSDYQLNDTRLGKPIIVFTKDDSDPSHIERTVPVFELQDLNFNWGLPNDIGTSMLDWNNKHSAWRIGYYRREGLPYVRFKPTPQDTAEYRVMYVIGNWADSAGLNDEPVLSEHHHLIEIRAAMSLLPFAEWDGSEDLNMSRRKALAMSLSNDASIFSVEFELYARSLHGQMMNERWMPEM